MQNFDTPAAITAILDVPAGRVRFAASDRTDTVVEVLPANPAKSRDVETAEQAVVTYADGVLRIRTAEPRNVLLGPGALDITVQLPAGSHVEARTESTELRCAGRLGDVAYRGAYRQIKVDEAASLRLTAVDGDIEVGRINGNADISTSRGDIRIDEAGRGAVALSTMSGSITIAATAGVSATLDAGTDHGRISNSLKNDGSAELRIRATTSSGDITARSL
ncbi:DUF4097 family beta strand repeat-containing protein [Kitasatospora cathayae]|uniref:DUF4097 family beta strand repeat-containing protein n=1 Tax=Kitasatospora cathayae TaxID=3004092 RepID=A0ABY7Q1V8_9ACTN|nr:DUF4097 family beta strand repeat-containing protein [Kitasatospora sp. HUAS 3-15]WBP86642.1 DUF4097 family beta strand repeat-containing protein [Kitasatospora sp. HUAS 3-15]